MKHCEARTTPAGDIACARCGLCWDADDNDPPRCPVENAPDPQQIIEQIKLDLEKCK